MISRNRIFFVVALAGVVVAAPAFGQETLDKRIGGKKDELQDIKSQIENHRRQSQKLKKDEKSVLGELSDLDKEIDLRRQFLKGLAEQEGMMTERVDSLQAEVAWRESSLDEQQTILARRLRQMYKRDPKYKWNIVLGGDGLEHALNRYRFMKIIAEQDAVMIRDFRERRRDLQVETAELNETLADMAMLRNDREEESKRLEASKSERKSVLTRIRSRQSDHERAIAQLKKSQKEVQDLLGRLEKKRLEEQARGVADGEFSKLKGSMLWPVEGKVTRGFGKIKHPKYGTVTFSNGINISAPGGTPIRAVAPGSVEFVDWIDAYGKCIIVNHGGAYYTLYAHVSTTMVAQGQKVDVGDVIAEVGDSGSLEGYQCHFEVRHGKQALDPLTWLSKRRKSSS